MEESSGFDCEEVMSSFKAPLTICSDLLASFCEMHAQGHFRDVLLVCSDGNLSVPGLILAAVSPIFRHLGSFELEDLVIMLPDYDYEDMKNFVQHLLSPQGPEEGDENDRFQELLDFFGREPPPDLKKKMEPEDPALAALANVDCILPSPDDNKSRVEVKEEPGDEDDDFQDQMSDDFMGSQYDGDGMMVEPKVEQAEAEKKAKKRKSLAKYTKQVKDLYDSWLKTYTCPQCDTTMKSPGGMANHLKWHDDHPLLVYQTRHACTECGKLFKKSGEVKSHMDRKHRVLPRIFKCTWENCNKAFKMKGELKCHMTIHTNEKNFICEDCGWGFRTKKQMESHSLRRHSNLQPSIPCEECGKLFRTREDVLGHQVTHRARRMRVHRCDECNLTFRKEGSLKKHMILHSADRPLACSKCPLRYKTKDQLRQHEMTHDGKRFPCTFCYMVFGRHDNLKRHVRTKHSNEKIQWSDLRTRFSRQEHEQLIRRDSEQSEDGSMHSNMPQQTMQTPTPTTLPPPQMRHPFEAYTGMFPLSLPPPPSHL